MSDSDDISITSTAPSEQQSEYEVETILTELDSDDGIKYLVKWANYPIERSTWEPADSFCAKQTLIDWNKKKKAIAEGKHPQFDLLQFENHLAALEKAKEERKQKRAAKRRKLALEETQQNIPTVESPPSDNVVARTSPGHTAVDEKQPFLVQAPKTNASTGGIKAKPQPLPTSQPPPPVSFGTAPIAARPKRMNSSDTYKLFSLSTRRRYEKAKTYEPPPDMNKLELLRPSEWPSRTVPTTAKIGPHNVNSPTTANESNTAKLGSHNVSSPVRGEPSPAKLGPHDVSSPKQADFNCSKLGPHAVSSPKQLDSNSVKLGPHDVSSPRPLYPTSAKLGFHSVSSSSPMDLDSDDGTQSLPRSPAVDSHRPTHNRYEYDSYKPASSAGMWRPDPQVSDNERAAHFRGDSWRPNIPSPSRHHNRDDAAITKHPARTPGPRAICVANGYFWNPGEILINMYYGSDKKDIGPARLCGLSQTSRLKLMASKKGRRIEVWFQHICNLEEYNSLCTSTSNQKYSTGWIEGFEDTEPSVYKIGEELRRNELVAILYPNHWSQNVLLAYSPRSSDFEFLNGELRTPAGVFLSVAVRSLLRPFDIVTTRRERERIHVESHKLPSLTNLSRQNPSRTDSPADSVTGPLSPRNTIRDMSIPGATKPTREDSKLRIQIPREDTTKPKEIVGNSSVSEKSPAQPSSVHDLQGGHQAPSQELTHPKPGPSPAHHEAEAPVSSPQALPPEPETARPAIEAPPMRAEDQSAPKAEPPVSPTTEGGAGMAKCDASADDAQLQASAPTLVDLDAIFKEQFGVTYNLLATVNDAERVRTAHVFYLMFPLDSEIVQQECKLIEAFLKQHNALIYSNHLPEDWVRFARTLSVGVVLVHESFTDYHMLPYFKELTRQHFSFWSVSLSRPLQYVDRPTNFQRLFPHGGVILITEDFMLREPDATVIILAWFKDWIKAKFPGSWKIMFRPDVLNWLLKQHHSKTPARQGVWLTMYSLIVQINTRTVGSERVVGEILNGTEDEHSENVVISPSQIPLFGSRTEDDDPNIPKGLTQEQMNADHLAEFFAGWALVNNHRYRRFVMATAVKPLPRWEAWQHVEIRYGAKDFFLKGFKVDYNHYWKKLTSVPGKTGPSSDVRSQQQNPTYTPRTPATSGPSSDGLDVSRTGSFPHGLSRLRYPQPYS